LSPDFLEVRLNKEQLEGMPFVGVLFWGVDTSISILMATVTELPCPLKTPRLNA
jgi:hypothetical protein